MKKPYLAAITALAFILRTYKISENFVFSGEFGTEFLYIKNLIAQGKLPLAGLTTSHTWISYGPLYYWIMIPLVKLFAFEPLIGAWVGIITGTLAVIANYLVIRKIANEKVAIWSSLIITVSPIWISFARGARLYVFTWLIFYLFLYFLRELWQGKAKNIFWLGFAFGLFFNFHFSPILLTPVLLVLIYLRRKILKVKDYLLLLLGAVLANLPILIYDSQNGFSMIKNLILWIPYRIAGFFGLYPKNNLSYESLGGTFGVINEFFGKMFIFYRPFWIVATIAFLVLAWFLFKENYRKFFKDFLIFFIFASLVSVLAGIFIHQSPPIHYFLPLFPIPPLILALVLDRYWKSSLVRYLFAGSFLLLALFNLKVGRATPEPDFVPYKLQKEISRFIASDVKGSKFVLKRVGPYDYFEGNYAQNYQYLLWLYGNEPVQEAKISYTIYEDTSKLPKEAKDIKWLSNVAVIRKEDK